MAILLFAACQKSKDQSPTAEIPKAKNGPAQFQYQDYIDPAILPLLKRDLIRDGYLEKAKDLSAGYDFKTGEKIILSAGSNDQARDFPTTSVGGVGTVLSNVSLLQSGSRTVTSYTRSATYSTTVTFNSMITSPALHAFDNSAPPANTYLPGFQPPPFPSSQDGPIFVGYKLPTIAGQIGDIDGNIFLTNYFPIRYSIHTSGGGWSSYAQSPNLVGSTTSCGFFSTSCFIDDTKIEIGGSPEFYLNDDGCLCLATKVKAYIYYRPNMSGIFSQPTWRGWVSEDQSIYQGSGIYVKGLQIRIYFIKIS